MGGVMNKNLFLVLSFLILGQAKAMQEPRRPSVIFSHDRAFLLYLGDQVAQLNKTLAQHGIGAIVHNHGNVVSTVNTAPSSLNIVQEGGVLKDTGSEALIIGASQPPTGWWQYLKSFFVSPSGKPVGPVKPTLGNYLWSHKKQLILRVLGAGYLYTNYQLFKLGALLQGQNCWSLWKSHIALSDFLELPHKILLRDLLAEIRKRHGAELSQESAAASCALFLREIEEEMQAISRYVKLVNMLIAADVMKSRCAVICSSWMPRVFGLPVGIGINAIASQLQIKMLFFVDDNLVKTAQDRLSRLSYLKNIFSQWLADVKVRNRQAYGELFDTDGGE
jgi:hypothetical protein